MGHAPSMSPSLLYTLVLFFTLAHGEPTNNSTNSSSDHFSEFDWKLTKAVVEVPKTNVLLSPVSLKLVLAMLYEGANGTTAKELEQLLEIDNGSNSKKYSNICKSLQASNAGYELDVGMKLFIDQEATPKKNFADKINELYNATIDSINFKNTSEAVAHINGWARSVTKGHIQHLLSEADANHNTLMLLLNAVYFKGLWQNPFDLEYSQEGKFRTDDDKLVAVKYMSGVQRLKYYDSVDLNSTMVRLPYMGEKFAMYIILPDEEVDLNEVISTITPKNIRAAVSSMLEVPVHISLPKFKFEFASSLAPVLKKLGVSEIFSNKAELHNIAEGPTDPVVSNVIQKAGIEINELGTTASVVTAVELVNKFGVHTTRFNASRPFLFFIEDDETKTVIFLGKVVNPVAPGRPIISATSAPSKAPVASSTVTKPQTPTSPLVEPGSNNNSVSR